MKNSTRMKICQKIITNYGNKPFNVIDFVTWSITNNFMKCAITKNRIKRLLSTSSDFEKLDINTFQYVGD